MPQKSLGPALLISLLAFAPPASAQAPPAPHFEVSSIKPAVPLQTQITQLQQAAQSGNANIAGMRMMQQVITDQRIDLNTLSLADLIVMAYRIKPYQLTSPDWMRSERYDVQATLPAGATKEQVPEMMQALLAERFKVKIHRDKKPQPVYALLVSKDGHKLKPAPTAPTPPPDDPNAQSLSLAGQDLKISNDGRGGQVITTNGATGAATMRIRMDGGQLHMEIEKASMAEFAEMLGQFLDKPVVDQTELAGSYQVQLDLTQEDVLAMAMAKASAAGLSLPGLPGGTPGQAATPSSGASIFTTVQKLGLRLESKNLPVDMIVVDSADKTPTEN
jgi:uncharacterized protein (TIGR03435 family)